MCGSNPSITNSRKVILVAGTTSIRGGTPKFPLVFLPIVPSRPRPIPMLHPLLIVPSARPDSLLAVMMTIPITPLISMDARPSTTINRMHPRPTFRFTLNKKTLTSLTPAAARANTSRHTLFHNQRDLPHMHERHTGRHTLRHSQRDLPHTHERRQQTIFLRSATTTSQLLSIF